MHTVRWRTFLTDSTSSSTLATIEGLLARAEAALTDLHLRREAGPAPDPSDPADPVRCLEIWIAALRVLLDGSGLTLDRRLSPTPEGSFPSSPRDGGRPSRARPCRTLRAPS